MTSVMGMAAYVKQELDAYEYQGDDLIAGITPTLVDWTNNPTDAADITDGDISTFCSTGNKITTAHQYAYFEWDLGAFYNILCDGVGAVGTTVGAARVDIFLWNGASWIKGNNNAYLSSMAAVYSFAPFVGMASKVRVGIAASSNSTLTPNIREFHVWRL